uniref:Insulin-like peptide 2 n=1 Tax=Sinonovacula constricta TaxID=98310 RepID=A0A0P0D7G8_SINCO|nr:insulin-like peptide 2 [Sinonovacula constricta]
MQSDSRWIFVVYMTLTELTHLVRANWDRTCTPFTRSFGPHPAGLCGRRIDEMLQFLCYDGYNESPYSRKKRDTEEKPHQSELGSLLIPREEANSYLVKRSDYFERGIVCECCYHHCSIMELFSYCRNGPGLYGIFKRSVDSHLKKFTDKITHSKSEQASKSEEAHLKVNRHKRISPDE